MNASGWFRVRAAGWSFTVAATALGAARAGAVDDLAGMLRLIPADGETMLVMDDLAAMESALAGWGPLPGSGGFRAESVRALRQILPFAEEVNVSAPLAFRPPRPGTADKAVYWLHVPRFREKIATLPTASEEGGLWRATDRNGVTWFARPSGDVVVFSASRIHVEAAADPPRTLAEEYAPYASVLASRNLLLHLKREAFAAALGGALETWAAELAVPDARGRLNPLSVWAGALLRDARALADQVRSMGVLLNVKGEGLAVTVILTFGEGKARERLRQCKAHDADGVPLGGSEHPLLAAAWREPFGDAAFGGPWLARRMDALDAPLNGVLESLRGGRVVVDSEQGFLRAEVKLESAVAEAARTRLKEGETDDGVRRLLDAFRGAAIHPTADPAHEALTAHFAPEAGFSVSGSGNEIILRVGGATKGNERGSENVVDSARLRGVLGQLDPRASLTVVADVARLGAIVSGAEGGAATEERATVALLGASVSVTTEGIRVEVYVPRESLERWRAGDAPSGPT